MKTIRIIKGQKGAALVEFAIVLPLLALLVGGMIELGLLLYNQQVITNASREAARAGIVKGDDETFSNDDELIAIVKNYCDEHLITFQELSQIADENISFECGGSACNESQRKVAGFQTNFSVKVSFDYYFLLPSLLNFGTPKPLTAKTIMKMEKEPPT